MRIPTRVQLTKRARKDLEVVPQHVAVKLQAWVDDVEERGLAEVRRVTGYHDEPLLGKMRDLRSFRLSKSYRGYYRVVTGEVELVTVERVDKHEY